MDTTIAVAMYKNGETVAAITKATGLTEHQIAAAVARSGVPFVADRHDPVPAAAAGLITWGMQHTSGRMRRLAEQARTALADLQQAQRREEAIQAAEKRVEAARADLANAERALRAAKGTPAARSTAARPDATETALIRSWARENGHPVAAVGLIPRPVVDAYRAARPEADRAA
ncbi:histone-like nucleoid-structuring protein Lsr2 [Kitasatospora sp. NPDC056181]|uniref:Lsr2 family DNA-binding protein n=1 Tax=Kitasatospora sp. NPDC056181 TaxID=3345737 RepID=UPI0035DB56C8